MTRLSSLAAVAAVAVSVGVPAGTPAHARAPGEPSAPPNIVVIVADDLGHGDVSSYGGDVATPSIDGLARGGIRFTDAYVTAPVCNPSRAGLMSGRYQQRWGQELNDQTTPPEGSPRGSLPRSETTLAAALGARGYATGAIGKWHLGMQPGYHPLDRGFDEFFGMASGTRYVDPSWPGVHVFADVQRFDPSEPRLTRTPTEESRRGLVRGREPARLEEYLTDQLASEGVAFIDRHRDRPFFLYLAFYAPHAPLETTDEYYRRFPQFEDERKRIYAAMLAALDDGVGRVLAKLAEVGVERNTIVVFVSDNGAAEYVDADGRRNAPFAGHKRNLYEGGIRLPFIVRWPARLGAGATYSEMVSTLDLLPTLLAATGDPPAASLGLDGANLLPYLTAERAGAPHQALFWRAALNGAVRRGDWKLLLAGDVVRLYDLATDPTESRDVSAAHPAVVEELRAAWRRWSEGLAAPRESARTVVTSHAGDSIRWSI